jgi:hypothetical protein
MDTTQDPVPEQDPPQPANVYPILAAALRVTDVPPVYEAEQVEPQLILPSVELMVPEPDFPTERVTGQLGLLYSSVGEQEQP